MLKYPILTIAGLDNSGGAGLLADVKTFTAFGCYGMSAMTLIAVQNSLGVQERCVMNVNTIKRQIETIFTDMPPKAIKLGMLLNQDIILMVAECLKKYAKNIPIILDPVMMCKGNISLLSLEATKALIDELVPLATIITPNIPEAMIIIGEDPTTSILTQSQIADRFYTLGIQAALIKGGHYETEDAIDLLIQQGKEMITLSTPRLQTPHTHGTGCTLSAAITACVGRGLNLEESVRKAKHFLTNALFSTTKLGLGQGNGPVDHVWYIENLDHLNKNLF